MTYKDCLDYLFSQLPMYQRIGHAAYKANLNTTIEFLKTIGNPEREFRTIHIAGTNGKGSVSHMLASILYESGYKTGLYTSPHLTDFRERVKINGKVISKKEVVRFVTSNKLLVEKIQPSFFEWTVALAFNYFESNSVDVAVIETGMGGRLDSTNVIIPELSIITNIGKDHVQFLGDSLAEIAREKAGIIKKEVPVLIGEYLPETKVVFEERAKILNSSLVFAQDRIFEPFECDLKGPYQKQNQQSVLSALEILKNKYPLVSRKSIASGLKNVVYNTGLKGRWQWLGKKPGILADIAHNYDGISIVFNEIKKMDFKQLHIVWGMVGDKDIKEILTLLPKDARYYFCKPNIPRGLEIDKLYHEAGLVGLNGIKLESVVEAIKKAKSEAESNDLIYIGGSTFVVAEALV